MALTCVNAVSAQEIAIKLGTSTISINDQFSITLQATGVPLEQYGSFPEIPGFTKTNVSNNTYTQNIEGENTTVYSFIQFYRPAKPGLFVLGPFKLKANGKILSSNGTQITVTDGNGTVPAPNPEDFVQPFANSAVTDEVDNLEPRGQVFFALSTDKKQVYVGEGFTATLALYVADNNTQELDFYNVAEQLQQLTQILKPVNCWEENFGITEIQEIPVKIKGKRYSQFKIYQATYFPFNTESVRFGQVSLKMLANINALSVNEDNPSDFRVYQSKPVIVTVRDLPEHPLKGKVPVGIFRLAEFVNKTKQETGKAFTYKFSIRGEGNIAAIKTPEVPPGLPFQFFNPNSIQNIYRSLGKVTGERTFSYSIIPQEPGKYNLGESFNWYFFNSQTGQYDTLASNLTITVFGESQEPTDVYGGTNDPFYADLKERNNSLKRLDRNRIYKTYANWAIAVMSVAFLVVFFWTRKQPTS